MRDHLAPYREISAETGYAGDPLDRLAARRADQAFVDALWTDPASRAVVFARDKPVLKIGDPDPDPWFGLAEAARLGNLRESVLLGRDDRGAVFGILLDDTATRVVEAGAATGLVDRTLLAIPGRDDLLVEDLRSLAMRGALNRPATAVLAGAKSLLYWHARHRFCSCCGQPSRQASAGWRRDCQACGASHFPRTDPVVIMLVIDGERCLLGRQPRFPAGMYSALAGFLEPGETIEEAVRREVREEAGIVCGQVDFVASQPWPFPSSLMIGCFARAITRDIVVDREELDDARWFSRDEARAMIEGRHPEGLTAPRPLAIARHLLSAWVDS